MLLIICSNCSNKLQEIYIKYKRYVVLAIGLMALFALTGCIDTPKVEMQKNYPEQKAEYIQKNNLTTKFQPTTGSLELVDAIQTMDTYGDRSRIEVIVDHKRGYTCYSLIDTNQYGSGVSLQCFPNKE